MEIHLNEEIRLKKWQLATIIILSIIFGSVVL